MARKRSQPDYKKKYTILLRSHEKLRMAVLQYEASNGVSINDPNEWTDEERRMLLALQTGKTIVLCRRLLRGMENTADEIAGHARTLAHAADEVKSRSKTTRLRVLAAKK
jgi:hypothetical protein